MVYVIDFSSDEAYYQQLRNQIILGIASASIREGDSLPSVRDMAETIGINMHTVNKTYAILRQEGYLRLDRRKGAVVAVSRDKARAMSNFKLQMRVILAEAFCNGISPDDMHSVVDEMIEDFSE